MDEGTLGLVLGLCVASVAFLAWRIERQAAMLRLDLAQAVAIVDQKALPDIPDFTELREDLEDLIQETIGTMRPPQIMDHLGGIMAQWAQFKMAKEMNALQMPTALADVVNPADEQP